MDGETERDTLRAAKREMLKSSRFGEKRRGEKRKDKHGCILLDVLQCGSVSILQNCIVSIQQDAQKSCARASTQRPGPERNRTSSVGSRASFCFHLSLKICFLSFSSSWCIVLFIIWQIFSHWQKGNILHKMEI